jgi:hypothetical protein
MMGEFAGLRMAVARIQDEIAPQVVAIDPASVAII